MINPELGRRTDVSVAIPFRAEKSPIRPVEGITDVQTFVLAHLFRSKILDLSIDPKIGPFPLLENPNENDFPLIMTVFEEARIKHGWPDDTAMMCSLSDDPEDILATLVKARNSDWDFKKVIVLVDREKGGVQKLRERGIDAEAVYTASQINDFCLTNGFLSLRQHEAVEADIDKNSVFEGIGLA